MCTLRQTLPVVTMSANIVRAYETARREMDPVAFEAARKWYRTANAYVRDFAARTGVPFATAVRLCAYFSANASWSTNVRTLETFTATLQSGGDVYTTSMYATRNMRAKALRILAGSMEPLTAGTARKVSNFATNIGDPSNQVAVTIDRHAARIATNDATVSVPNGGAYDKVAEAYRHAAAVLGLLPCEVQAITWTHLVGDLP